MSSEKTFSISHDIETVALNLLQRGNPDGAVAALRKVIEADPKQNEDLARLLYLISPAQMIAEAMDGLRQRLNSRFFDQMKQRFQPPVIAPSAAKAVCPSYRKKVDWSAANYAGGHRSSDRWNGQ